MMVSEFSYSKKKGDLKTLIAIKSEDQKRLQKNIRNKKGLSKMDKIMLNRFYKCNNQIYNAKNVIGESGKILIII